jgi:hypothetical protein
MDNSKKDWEKVITYIEQKKPNYGVICIELTFHQNSIKKVKLLQKEDILILNKEKKNE